MEGWKLFDDVCCDRILFEVVWLLNAYKSEMTMTYKLIKKIAF